MNTLVKKNCNKDSNMDDLFQIEEKVRAYWQDIGLSALLQNKEKNYRKNKKMFIGPIGPATKNSVPSLHHVYSKTIRDIIIRYNFMNQYKTDRKIYWEAHGSTVEKQAKKELSLTNDQDILSYGIDNYCDYCKKIIFDNYDQFQELSQLIGEFETLNSHHTTDDMDYVESVWWILKQLYQAGFIQKNNILLNYCGNCNTIVDNFDIKKNAAINPVRSALILIQLDKPFDNIKIAIDCLDLTMLPFIEGVKYNDCDYIKYKEDASTWIMSFQTAQKYNLNGTRVSLNDIIHLFEKPIKLIDKYIDFIHYDNCIFGFDFFAPGYNKDDFEYSKNIKRQICNYVNTQGDFVYNGELYSQISSVDLALNSIKKQLNIKKHILFEKEYCQTAYQCKKCHSQIISVVSDNMIIKTSGLRDAMKDNMNKIKWIPEGMGKNRMMDWLNKIKDWNISRSRFFGTPIPLFECDCGYSVMIGSISELQTYCNRKIRVKHLYVSDLNQYEIICPHCKKEMKRVPYTLDCWFDSGAFSFAQHHYPFDDAKIRKLNYQADLIVEGVDQTRGWFYSLLFINTFLTGLHPSKSILTFNMLLDEKGKKMSKVRGTAVSPFNLIKKNGADALRWSLMCHSPLWANINFRETDVDAVRHHFVNKLFSISQYIIINGSKIQNEYSLHPLCIWLFDKTNNLIKKSKILYENYKFNLLCIEINKFIDNILSKQYIFYVSKLSSVNAEFISTLFRTFNIILAIIAPLMPHISEYLYLKLNGDNKKSIHLMSYPTVGSGADFASTNLNLDNEIHLLGWIIHNIISVKCNNLKESFGTIIVRPEEYQVLCKYEDIILSSTKCVAIKNDNDGEFIITRAKCNKEKYGSILRKDIKEYSNLIESFTQEEIEHILLHGSLHKENKTIVKEMLQIEKAINGSYLGKAEDDLCVVLV